jgi:hypothetical protein
VTVVPFIYDRKPKARETFKNPKGEVDIYSPKKKEQQVFLSFLGRMQLDPSQQTPANESTQCHSSKGCSYALEVIQCYVSLLQSQEM